MATLDTVFEKTFHYAAREARRFYFQVWRRASKPCPAFKDEVVKINRIGWDHLLHAERTSKLDVLGRFFTLERAKVFLETATSYQTYREDGKTEYWGFDGIIDGVKIMVIVRALNQGSKHFYSVIRRGAVAIKNK